MKSPRTRDFNPVSSIWKSTRRFADALDQVGTVRGARIHRSHWVLAQALSDVTGIDGKPDAIPVDGRRLPISRSDLASAKALVELPAHEAATGRGAGLAEAAGA